MDLTRLMVSEFCMVIGGVGTQVSQLFVLSIFTVIIDLLIMDVNNYFNVLSNKWGQKIRELSLEVGKLLDQCTLLMLECFYKCSHK